MADASHEAHFERLKALVAEIAKYLAKGAASKGGADPMAHVALQEGALLLLELKEVNRSVWEAVAANKSEAKAANESLDSADLLLQNLQYEKNHFLREIRHARDFHGELAVDMVDKAAFAATAPAELRGADEASDPHQYHLNRLEHELRQRQELCATREELKARKAALSDENGKSRAFLEGLGAKLQSLMRISLPLQALGRAIRRHSARAILRAQFRPRKFARAPPPLTRAPSPARRRPSSTRR